MHVKAIVTRPVETCTIDESAANLAARMLHSHVGDLIVIEYRKDQPVPIGIVTDRDLAISVMAPKLNPESVTAGQIMSRSLIVVSEKDDVSVALEEMRRSGVRRLPVVNEDGRLSGVLALDDVMAYLASIMVDISRIGRVQQIAEQRTHA
ncbi:CBS domain-containing protein [Trinickia dinghuensis]|uniref:CBS domain-containing protein n=1 Tax=Trinickia dinghuensis TaxID=2291023 RepID=A0A3D8K316_9BURK|nr:CBS domain-containing protein [Trinickia dinghuensis]RDU99432.1 CBS domain-containing protein [Trinickia dinghuensis]